MMSLPWKLFINKMATFVIAGKADCCLYARAEMLGDVLAARLPHFKATKVVISSEDWASWLAEQCDRRGWSHSQGSPLVWRELVDTGGKGLYLGGLAEFEGYAMKYHNISPPTEAHLEKEIAAENFQTYQQQLLQKEEFVPVPPVRVCVTNCSSAVAYHLAQLVASGAVMGPAQKVALHLYDSQHNSVCESLATELLDLASPLLEYATFTSSLLEAFDNIDIAFLLDYPYCARNLEPSSLEGKRMELAAAATMFQKYASTLDFAASKDVKVIVSGSFANTGAALLTLCASSLAPACFVAAPCLAESQAKAVLANRLQLNSSNIKQLAVWGRTHGTVIADHTPTRVAHFQGAVVGPDPFDLPLTKCEFDREWLQDEFPKLIAARHNQLEGYREQGPSLAEAVGLANLGRAWSIGDTTTWQSVGIVNDGQLQEVPPGVTCSVPCHCKGGKWEPVSELVPPKRIQEQLSAQVAELRSELETAASILGVALSSNTTANTESPNAESLPNTKSPNTESLPSKSPNTDFKSPNTDSKSPNTESLPAESPLPTKSPNTESLPAESPLPTKSPNTESLASTES